MVLPERGLLIRQPWIGHILRGEKTWELRSRPTQVRGPVGLIQSGSGSVVGVANLVEVRGPLTPHDLQEAIRRGQITGAEMDVLSYPKTYAWVLEGARPVRSPVPYPHPQGAIIWVRLEPGVQRAVSEAIPG